MTEVNAQQRTISAEAPRIAAAPPVGAPRPGSFWQRWKEWERTSGTVASPERERAA